MSEENLINIKINQKDLQVDKNLTVMQACELADIESKNKTIVRIHTNYRASGPKGERLASRKVPGNIHFC